MGCVRCQELSALSAAQSGGFGCAKHEPTACGKKAGVRDSDVATLSQSGVRCAHYVATSFYVQRLRLASLCATSAVGRRSR